MTVLGRGADEVDALVTDRYLESLLSARGGSMSAGPFDLDEGVRLAADRLRRDLPRFHPSFRFEERLALRLAGAAARMHVPAAAGAEGIVIPFGAPAGSDEDFGLLEAIDGDIAGDDEQRGERARPLLIGGAITSAALTIAGAAWVAWKRSRAVRAEVAGETSRSGLD